MFCTVYLDLLNDDHNFERYLGKLYVAVPMLERIGLFGNWPTLSFNFNLCILVGT